MLSGICDVMADLILVCACVLFSTTITTSAAYTRPPCDITSEINITFIPAKLSTIKEGDSITFHMLLPIHIADWSTLVVTSSDKRVVQINQVVLDVNGSIYQNDMLQYQSGVPTRNKSETNCQELFTQNGDSRTVISVKITAHRLGKAYLTAALQPSLNSSFTSHPPSSSQLLSFDPAEGSQITEDISWPATTFPQTYPVVVIRDIGLDDKIFHIVVQVLLAIINFAYGCELDLTVVIAYLKRPLAPFIGFCCQFLLMPLLGLAITQLLNMDYVFGIGLIALSCAPGGGSSNAWTILLEGDINLSLTMTFFSLILALGMMPLWLFIVSRLYFDTSVLTIPYLNIFTTLCYFVVPCFVGILLKRFKPKLAQPLTKIIKPLSIIFLIWIISFGTYVNLYMWKIMGEFPLTIVAGILLPWCGFLFGFSMSVLTHQGKERATAISIETGIQNFGIPIVLLQRSFPQPEGDLAATMVNSVSVFTPVPLIIALVTFTIRKKCFHSKTKSSATVDIIPQSDIDIESAETVIINDTTSCLNNVTTDKCDVT